MGKSESVEAFIGIKILLSELLPQMKKDNFELICEMLNNGYIQDSNEHFNDVYADIIAINNHMNVEWTVVKEYLIDTCKSECSYLVDKVTGKRQPNIYDGFLWDQYLLVPFETILESTRYGYDRYGTNGTSRPLDFDLLAIISMQKEKYKRIEKVEMVFMLQQHSG